MKIKCRALTASIISQIEKNGLVMHTGYDYGKYETLVSCVRRLLHSGIIDKEMGNEMFEKIEKEVNSYVAYDKNDKISVIKRIKNDFYSIVGEEDLKIRKLTMHEFGRLAIVVEKFCDGEEVVEGILDGNVADYLETFGCRIEELDGEFVASLGD